jgi:hypothetical protein
MSSENTMPAGIEPYPHGRGGVRTSIDQIADAPQLVATGIESDLLQQAFERPRAAL